MCDGAYWWTICATQVQFAAAVQATMRTATGSSRRLSPHPLLTQAGRSLGMSVAMAGMRQAQPLPHGLRGADERTTPRERFGLFGAVAGRRIECAAPAWTHARLFIDDDGQSSDKVPCTITVHPIAWLACAAD